MDSSILYGLLHLAVVALLVICLVSTIVVVVRRRQREYWLQQDLLNSVYNARERRIRGD